MALSAHMGLHVLLAGSQGSGKSTWARLLHALTPKPEPNLFVERERWLGVEEGLRWRPLLQPHHSVTPLAMVGGGHPIVPGVITRAHGGVLLLDEFLEFHPQVLENLREPVENGRIEIARRGSREILPARFQLVATTNLCPCGRLQPQMMNGCPKGWGVARCRSVVWRMGGPLLDRFDLLVFTHDWPLRSGRGVLIAEVAAQVEAMRVFARKRGAQPLVLPSWVEALGLSFRRKTSLLRVARGLADQEGSVSVTSAHFNSAMSLVVSPIRALDQLFA